MKRLLPLLVICTGYSLHAQITRSPLSNLYTGTGAYSKHFTDAFSGTANQAALAFATVPTAGVYGERRFMLAELGNYAAALSWPLKSGGLGASLHYFGAGGFNSSQLGMGYGRKLSDKGGIGAQINYNALRVAGYGGAGTVNFELGTLWHIRDKWHLGMHIYNPVGGRFGKDATEKLASVYTVGIGYEASDVFFIGAALLKEEDQPATLQPCLQYAFAKYLLARAGISTATGHCFVGIGVKWKTWRLDAVTQWHPQLGYTPALLLLFDLKEDKEETPEP